jgi:hypothetical protein
MGPPHTVTCSVYVLIENKEFILTQLDYWVPLIPLAEGTCTECQLFVRPVLIIPVIDGARSNAGLIRAYNLIFHPSIWADGRIRYYHQGVSTLK